MGDINELMLDTYKSQKAGIEKKLEEIEEEIFFVDVIDSLLRKNHLPSVHADLILGRREKRLNEEKERLEASLKYIRERLAIYEEGE